MPQEKVIQCDAVFSSDVITLDFPASAILVICTGTAAFDFEGTEDGITRGAVQFLIPKESEQEPVNPQTNPLDLSPLLKPGTNIHEATTASLTSFTGNTGPWAVDGVEVVTEEEGTPRATPLLSAGLAVGKGSHLLRMSYQVNLLLRVL
jgi:hypothetical protein